MARSSIDVTYAEQDPSRLPDQQRQGAALLVDLQRGGILELLARRLRIRRQGGYCGLDVWVLLFLYLSSGAATGIRKFWDAVAPFAVRLGALAGRKRLMAPASLSRALGNVELELLRPEAGWLLTGLSQIDPVLAHPTTKCYDARGQTWHVFHVDPTVTTLRHRALPADEDSPEARRRSEQTGAPGYSGRKRGDCQFRRVTVQHAGSGAWIHAHLSPGNGDGMADLQPALESIVATVQRLAHPTERTLVVLDGEYGNVPAFSTLRQAGLPFVTRLNRPALYKDPTVLEQLRKARWMEVVDSGSGPRRSAADVGVITLHPGERTRRADGTRYEPVRLRVVASILPCDGDEAQRGQLLDGWQVELFVVDADASAWPATDAVAVYFGRNAQENRFAQEDRELGLDRIVSYHLPGQELAVLVGLSLWNLRIARGFALETPDVGRPAQPLRRQQPDLRVPPQWPRDPVIADTLRALDWEGLLADRAGWHFDAPAGELRCEAGRTLTVTTVRPYPGSSGRIGVVLRRPTGGCEGCEARTGCLHSERPRASKHIEIAAPAEVAEALRARLAALRGAASAPPSVAIAPVEAKPPAIQAASSLFLPAEARQRFGEVFALSTLHVEVEQPPPPPPRPRLVARDEADRQRRRCTWQQNVDRYALPSGAKVHLRVSGSADLRRMLGERPPALPGGKGRAG